MSSDELASMIRGMRAAGVQGAEDLGVRSRRAGIAALDRGDPGRPGLGSMSPEWKAQTCPRTPGTPAAALWKAQREWLKIGRTDDPFLASPFFWASAVVIA